MTLLSTKFTVAASRRFGLFEYFVVSFLLYIRAAPAAAIPVVPEGFFKDPANVRRRHYTHISTP